MGDKQIQNNGHHYVIGILLQIERKIKLIDNWSNKTDTLFNAQQVKHST